VVEGFILRGGGGHKQEGAGSQAMHVRFAAVFWCSESNSKQLLSVNLKAVCSDPSTHVQVLGHVHGQSSCPVSIT
jgi:hypothetical protein